ncbi:hypothetical protein MMC07_000727 [Pseudocyphellaria aurata]|nr:hypothetical protein [Pseudocyphellaria aurata]
MPGILPMKVIRVGTSAQSRIAQACDRCRSKKIRCDGVAPCCSQCANVGFECKTSDKLSRRAFPRGYTESLEGRVRQLETEVKELKDLLDEKDEKIDILSRIRPSSISQERPSVTKSIAAVTEAKPVANTPPPPEDVFRVQQATCLLQGDHQDSFFMGASSGRSFVDAFKVKTQECGKPCSDFKPETFFLENRKSTTPPKASKSTAAHPTSKAPPRLTSDQMINIFFQEWAPLFPVLHRPTFLNLYAEYVANPDGLKNQQSIAQLNLVFNIAALSAEWNRQNAADYERQWQTAMDALLQDNSLATLQCLVLAQICCIAKGDYDKLLHYKGFAISLCHRLGLHQSQKRFSLGALTTETRKKVFWVVYMLDRFSAALLGLPKLINEGDIEAEYPLDVDDENVSERGFQSTLPGESTRVSSALALFRVARILSKVLDEIYPSTLSHELSLQKIGALNDELGVWLQSLAPHHRLQFVQDKPSTNVVGSRSPLLSLAYHYIRTLIHRPALGSSLGAKASASLVAVASSSKHIVQIVQLLEERRMSFSFCLNKNELLVLSGFGLLFQGLDLNRKGKLMQDSQKLMCSIIEILERGGAPNAKGFTNLASAMISIDRGTKSVQAPKSDDASRRKSDNGMAVPKTAAKSARKQLQAFASRFSSSSRTVKQVTKQESKNARRSKESAPVGTKQLLYDRSESQNSISSVVSEPTGQLGYSNTGSNITSTYQIAPQEQPNLEYLSFNHDLMPYPNLTPLASETQFKEFDPESIASYLGSHQPQQGPTYDNLFQSPSEVVSTYISPSPSSVTYDWSSDVWTRRSDLNTQPASAQSVLSFSEEEVTSGEELSSCDAGGDYRGILMPNVDGYGRLEGFERFGL